MALVYHKYARVYAYTFSIRILFWRPNVILLVKIFNNLATRYFMFFSCRWWKHGEKWISVITVSLVFAYSWVIVTRGISRWRWECGNVCSEGTPDLKLLTEDCKVTKMCTCYYSSKSHDLESRIILHAVLKPKIISIDKN